MSFPQGATLPTVSIITPCYNAADYLGEMLASILQQPGVPIELICVDDSSTDNSYSLLEEFCHKHEGGAGLSIKLVRQSTNAGAAAARNTALRQASGKYIYYLDADDTLEAGALAPAIEYMEREGLDIVGVNWNAVTASSRQLHTEPIITGRRDALKQIFLNKRRPTLWAYVASRDLYLKGNVKFIDGADMGEDLGVISRLFTIAGKVGSYSGVLYNYRVDNPHSLTRTLDERALKAFERNINAAELAVRSGSFGEIGKYLNVLKLRTKEGMLFRQSEEQLDLWRRTFPEANKYALLPGGASVRTRVIQWLAWHKQDWLVHTYSRLLDRLRG